MGGEGTVKNAVVELIRARGKKLEFMAQFCAGWNKKKGLAESMRMESSKFIPSLVRKARWTGAPLAPIEISTSVCHEKYQLYS
jgi:hypothetical protein